IRHVRRPGHGAAFVLELPVEPAPVWPERAVIVAAKPALRGCSILVVDDEPDVVGVLADLLKADGVRIDTASDGRLALERLSEADYDLIVCDVRMPGIDGPALYRALQERRPEFLPRIVFLTGDTLNPDSEAFV